MVSLGIDIGGTGCKCVAFRDDGTQLETAYQEYPNQLGKPNLDPVVLRDAVFWVIARCVDRLSNPGEVGAITVSSFGESFVSLDACGVPLTDIILYFANSESAEFDHLVQHIGTDRIMEITRALPADSYSLSKMLYTRKVAARPVWKYLFVASYLCWCLSGETVCDESLACRSLLYDVREHVWSQELLQAAGLCKDQLPTVVPTGTAAGKLLAQVAGQFRLSDSVQVVIGGHDQLVNALGSGVCTCTDAVDTTGTCECITPLFSQLPGMDFTRSNFACVPYVDGRGFLTYAYNVSAGAVVKWYRDTLAVHLQERAEREQCSIYELLNQACPAEPTNLLVLPYFQGMGGTPDVRSAATGQLVGLTTATTLPQIYRGILEGLCFEMAYNLEKLADGGVLPERLYACGGGARSKIWLRIKADVWGREIIPVRTEETGALGSAILGFAAILGVSDRCMLARRFLQHGTPIVPNVSNHAYYMSQYLQFKSLRKAAIR